VQNGHLDIKMHPVNKGQGTAAPLPPLPFFFPESATFDDDDDDDDDDDHENDSSLGGLHMLDRYWHAT